MQPRFAGIVLGTLFTLLPLFTFAQVTPSHAPPNTPNVKRIEGTVARVEGNEFLLKAKGGTTETYQLSPSVQIIRSRPGTMSDLGVGKSVSCTTLLDHDPTMVAGECRILPDGTEGSAGNPSPAQTPNTSTVNGTVTDVRDESNAKGKSRLIQIADKDHTTAVTVFSLTKIAIVTAADATGLKPGMRVRGISQQAADGTGVIQTLTIMSAGQ